MELIQVTQELYKASRRLDKASKEIFKLAEKKALTENAYRQKLAEEMMKLKAGGESVTLIPDISRGRVAFFKQERDLADGLYKSALSSMRALETEISALQTVARYCAEVEGGS